MITFKKASKSQGRLRFALIGQSGGGKTYTALSVATALAAAEGGRIAVIDTEHGSASKYASGKPFDFDVLELTDFNPRNYSDAIRAAGEAGYSVIIVDSLSHAWTGKGGALEMKDNASRRAGVNSFTAWKDITPLQNELIDTMLQSRCHIIATMRAKTEYVIEKDERTGKSVPRKIGLAPVQRDQIEFEFDLAGEMDQENTLTITKTRCPELAGKCLQKPGADLAKILLGWLSDGAPEVPAAATALPVATPVPADPLSPGVDIPAMASPPPASDAVRLAWEKLKGEQPTAAKDAWRLAVCAALGVVDPKARPSSTWTAAELDAVKAQLWPARAA
jgi:hypothetical protein